MSEIKLPRERNIETVRAFVPSEFGDLMLAVRRKKTSKKNAGLWEAPGGQREFDQNIKYTESREVCVIRETEQETGLIIRTVGALTTLAHRDVNDVDMEGTYVAFGTLSRVIDGKFKLGIEHDAFEWVDPLRLPNLDFTTVTTRLIGLYNLSELGV